MDLVVLCSVGYFFQGIFHKDSVGYFFPEIFHKYFVGYFFREIFLTRMFFCCGTSKLVVFALVSVTDEFTLVFNLLTDELTFNFTFNLLTDE